MSLEKRIAWAIVTLGVILLLAWSVHLVGIGLSLRKHLAQVQTLADDPKMLNPSTTCGLVHDLRVDVVALRQQAGGLVQLAPALGWLPKIGGDLQAAPHLLGAADGLTEAGVLICDSLEPVLSSAGEGTVPTPEQIIDLLTREQTSLEQALAATERAHTAWERVNTDKLSPWLAGKVTKLDEGLPLMQIGLQTATMAPDLLGADEPRTYLILAQNEDELRPTGGFISGAGTVTIKRGQITELRFIDASLVDDFLNKPYPAPPAPLFAYMGSDLWLFRDVNWSPDFPTSARQAAHFYEYGQDVSADGVIALNQQAVEMFMEGLGKVYISGMDEPVMAANVRHFMREAWNPGEAGPTQEWIYSRKEFIGQLTSAILERIESDPGSIDWVQVAKGLYQALNERHLLIFVDDVDMERALARIEWDGSLRESPGDYLMVVDANLGFGKVNPLINESIDYQVALKADGTAAAELALTYTHRGQRQNVRCEQHMPYTSGLVYEEMIHRCYYDYMRVYAPTGSVLRTATPHPTPAEYLIRETPADGQVVTLSDEAGKTVFGQFFVVEYGQSLATRLKYDLPRVVQTNADQNNYTLLIQKQAGTNDIPVSLTIILPPDTKLLTATPPPQTTSGDKLTFNLQFDTDALVKVTYE